ncbi:MAG: replication initiation protein, partial [Oligoflexia bacterium]|nr:replication initiation protein [Oligoflexia bacterium]
MNIVENKVALQPYRITMSKHQLTAIELRLLNLCFFHLKEEHVQGFCNDVMNKKGLFDTHKIIKIKNADITVNSNYEHVRKALYKLTKRDIELDSVIDGKPSTLITNLIHYADYSKDKTTIEIEINKRLVPEFLKLGKNYTKYGIDFGFKTQCRYAIRWYQLACHWQKKGSFRVNIDDIKKLFKISSHMYSRLESFRRRVIT